MSSLPRRQFRTLRIGALALRRSTADRRLRQNDLFWDAAQTVLEMAAPKSQERTLLEAVVAWGRGKVPEAATVQQERFL